MAAAAQKLIIAAFLAQLMDSCWKCLITFAASAQDWDA